MFIERLLGARLIVELHRLVEDAPVARLFQICPDSYNQPVGVVIEIPAHIVVALLGQRLVLVIRSAAWKLRGGKVEDTLASALRYHVDEAQQILVGIPEAEPASDARFVE